MDESLNYHVGKSTPRGLIRHFLEVAEEQDTPRQFTNRVVAANTRSAQVSPSKQRRVSGPRKGGRNMQSGDLHSQSKQSTSLMDKSMNVSLIQGINKTYSNIVAPDSNNSSIDTSIDLAKAARFRTKKRKLKTAPHAAAINKPLLRKKSKWSVVPFAISAGETTAPEAQDAPDRPEKSSSTKTGAVENEMHTILPENTSSIGGAEDIGHMSMSPDVSSMAISSDGTYDFTTEHDDDTLPYEAETERRFRIQTASNKLILPSLIEGLQAKQKSGGSATVDKIAPTMRVTSPEIPAREAIEEEQNELYSTSQNVTDDISPPPNFRDVKASRPEVLHAASFSDYLGESTPRAFHLEKYEKTSRDKLPETVVPVENKDISVNSQRRASAGQRKSVGQVTDAATATTTTPTRSAQRKGVGQVITPASTTITPTRSSQKKSVGQVTTPSMPSSRSLDQGSATKSSPRRSLGHGSTSKSSRVVKGSASRSSRKNLGRGSTVRSSPRRSMIKGSTSMSSPVSVGEGSAIRSSSKRSVGKVSATVATPTKSPLQQNVSRNVTYVLVSPQKSDRVEETGTARSVGRKGMSQAEQGGNRAMLTELSPLDKGARRLLIYSEEEDAHDSQDVEAAQSVSDGKEGNELVFQSDSKKGKSPEKAATSKSLTVDENALLSDTRTEYSLIPVPEITVKQHRYLRRTLIRDVDEREKSPPNIQALPTPRETPKEQSSAPSSTAKVRQMTMREFLEKLKTKPMQPPLAKPRPLLPSLLGDAAPSTSQPKPPLRPKHKKDKKRVLPASLPPSLTKEVFTHFAKCRVTSGALDEVVRVTEIFWKNFTKDLCAIHATKAHPTKAIQNEDVEKLMKRQGLITSEKSLIVLVEELLPMETWSLFKPFPEPARNPFPPFDDLHFNSKKFADLDD